MDWRTATSDPLQNLVHELEGQAVSVLTLPGSPHLLTEREEHGFRPQMVVPPRSSSLDKKLDLNAGSIGL